MQNLLKSLPESVKQVIMATLPLAIVVILFVTVGRFGISKVSDLRSQITQGQVEQTILTQKLNLLQELSSVATQGTGFAIIALPSDNWSLTVISQLKILAGGNGVTLSSIKSGSATTNQLGLSEADISFTAEGARAQIIFFIKGIAEIAPITSVDKIRFAESTGTVKADITVKSYWAPLPKTIPAVDQPMTDLTSVEKQTLTQISSLTQPILNQTTPLVPSTGPGNPNPFGQ